MILREMGRELLEVLDYSELARRLRPWLAGVALGAARLVLGKGVVLYHPLVEVRTYEASAAGLGAALGDAVSGDVVFVPAGSVAGDFDVPGGVRVQGFGGNTTLAGQVRLGAGAELCLVAVVNAGAGERAAVIGPESGTGYLRDCNVVGESTDGAGYALECRGGNLHAVGCGLSGTGVSGRVVKGSGAGTTTLLHCQLTGTSGLVTGLLPVDYAPGVVLASGQFTPTNEAGHTISTGLTPGNWYCLEAMSWFNRAPNWPNYTVAVNYDGNWYGGDGSPDGPAGTFYEELNSDGGYPALNNRIYFVAAGTSALGRCSDSPGQFGDNDDRWPMDWRLREASAAYAGLVYVQGCSGDTAGGIPLAGDRGVYDAAGWPARHANDVDAAAAALHHTIGSGPNQAAAGDHTHGARTEDVLVAQGAAGPELKDSHLKDGVTGNYLASLAAALTSNRTYTLQDADMTLAGLNLAQTWTANQRINGALGINVDPQAAVHARSDGTGTAILLEGFGGAANYIGGRANGTVASPTQPASGQVLTAVIARGWDGTSGFVNSALYQLEVDGTPSGGDIPGRVALYVHRAGDTAGTVINRWTLYNDGAVTQTPIHDAVNTVKTVRTSRLRLTSGTAGAGFGQRWVWQLRSSTTNDQDAGALDVAWVNATHASRTAEMVFYTVASGTMTEALRLGQGVVSFAAALKPPQLADAAAPNGTIYYSTTQNKLVYKDPGGVVNGLY